jgi:type IV pilus biogenesis protein CpaD/CtpE
MPARLLLTLAATGLLAGCAIDPRSLESVPVDIPSAKGAVTCQLYTRETTVWDRSIDRPDAMGVEEADTICREAGRRWARGTLENPPQEPI